jgi:cardiolipin synthase
MGLRASFRLLGLSLSLSLIGLAAASTDVALYEHGVDGSPALDRINRARSTLDLELYEMTDPVIHNALLMAAKRGVRIRILLESRPVAKSCDLFESYQRSSTKPLSPEAIAECDLLKRFKRNFESLGGVMKPFSKGLCGAGSGYPHPPTQKPKNCYQHGKLILVDQREALLSTGNLNPTSLCHSRNIPRCNRDFTVGTINRNSIRDLQTIFERDWAGVPYNVTQVLPSAAFQRLSISPFSSLPLVRLIQSARISIEIEQQYLNDPALNDAILAATQRGVSVRLLISSLCSFGWPKETERRKATITYGRFDRAGVKTRMFTSSIRINGRPGYLHSKAIIIDGERAWIGSVNGSATSMNHNREFGIFIHDQKIIQKMRSSFVKAFQDPNTETWRQSLQCTKDAFNPAALGSLWPKSESKETTASPLFASAS